MKLNHFSRAAITICAVLIMATAAQAQSFEVVAAGPEQPEGACLRTQWGSVRGGGW